MSPVLLFLIFVITLVIAFWGRIYYVSWKAMRLNVDQLPVFGPLIQLIFWQPNESVVLWKNGRIEFVEESTEGSFNHGGSRLIYPLMGQEVFARFPLTIRTSGFQLKNLSTQEGIPLEARGQLTWEVEDPPTLVAYLCSGRGQSPIAMGDDVLARVERLLILQAEKAIRRFFSKRGFASSPQSRKVVLGEMKEAQSGIQIHYPASVDSLFAIDDRLVQEMDRAVIEYGIRVVDVFWEIVLPKEIQAAFQELWASSLLPVTSAHEALALEVRLKALADVIGIEAAILKELLESYQGTLVIGHPPLYEALRESFAPERRRSVTRSDPDPKSRLFD